MTSINETPEHKEIKHTFMFKVVAFFLLLLSCKKESSVTNTVTLPITTDSTISATAFNFKTTKTVSININLQTNNGSPIAGVPVNVYAGGSPATEPIATAITDASGALQTQVEIPAYLDTVTIDPKYVGLMRNAKAVISGGSVTGTIGGPSGYSGSIVQNTPLNSTNRSRSLASFSAFATVTGNTTYTYMGTYDDQGVPNYLVSPPDVISAQLLSFLNTSLPEGVDVRKLHPQYLQSTATSDINITQTADVWVTFVSEGAGYLNSLGYYTYPTGNPPQSASDITQIYYIFPNASLPGSGGDLKSGSKVKLGRFNAGTSIGFVLLSNAWNGGSKTINSNAQKFYSTTVCNPETDTSLKRHTVLLYDADQNLFMTGFEDMFRQNPSCDNDFNDVVFYTTSNPVNAISQTNVQPIDQPKDSDGDGVPDNLDQFPNDPTRAYITYYPSKSTFATVAFEDLWPATGDYDMNDMVVGYRYTMISNAQNQIVETYADYMVEASGASYVSGFGVQFPFSPSQVRTVTGQRFASNYIQQNSNGTEANQSKAVIIPFDSYKAIIKRPGGYYINSQIGAPYVTGDTVHVYIGFNNPLPPSVFGSAPFNPFLISNQRRGYEVHLPNNAPTDLADKSLFGTLQDASNPSAGIYYKTKKGWPWALNFAGPFNYPAEGISIGKAYNYFLPWAQSGGTQYQNWYLNLPGNTNPSMIYTH
jgi:LruC domain-containing protein